MYRVPNMVLMQYISAFFSGFILSKFDLRGNELMSVRLPFPLTLGFKSLLARDLAMPDLDVRWVS
jgi:hypothetical protein